MVKTSSEQHLGKKLISAAMDTHPTIIRPVKSFALKSSVDFASRSLNVFNQLNALESNHESWMSKNETHDSFDLGNQNVLPSTASSAFKKPFEPSVFKKPFEPSVFKKPFEPISRKTKMKPFSRKRSMKKWIKYSLKDIPISSDATNTAVALQFLNELRKNKEKNNDANNSPSLGEKVVFHKPVKKREVCNSSVSPSHSVCHTSKHLEETGVKQKNNLKFSVKLDHLEDVDDL